MKKFTALPLFGALILSAVLFVAVYFLLRPSFEVEALSLQEAKERIQELYHGEVKNISEDGDFYLVEMAHPNGIYEIKMTANGEIHSIRWLEQTSEQKETPAEEKVLSEEEIRTIVLNSTDGTIQLLEKLDNNRVRVIVEDKNNTITLDIDNRTGEIIEKKTEQKKEPAPQRITEEEAKQLAKKIINGEVKSVKQEMKNNVTYYLVEIATDDDTAIVQIHSVTGKHLSTTWIDDDDDDIEDDDDDNDDDDD